ncbi:ABC transporter permease [Chloroflexota bacterium]
MSVALSFLRRDLSVALSYRLSFILQFGGIFFNVAVFYFLSQLFGNNLVSQLDQYGGDYFSFVLVGIAFTGYMGLSLSTFAGSIRQSQITGTLEIMLLSPTRLSVILISSSLWSYLLTTINVLVYFLLGIFVFGVNLGQANFFTAIIVLILSITSFSGIGILAAAFILWTKRGDPITWVFGSLSTLLAGVYYPVTVLPDWLEPISNIVPMTHALDAMRLAMLQGYSLYEVRYNIFALLGFTLVLTPLAFLVFRKALKRAKMEGSLIQY